MVFGKQIVRVGALTVALVGFGAGFGSGMQGQTTTSTPQQNVPDAPRPQALPQLNTITPVGSALPSAPQASTSASAPADASGSDGQTAPSAALPSTPAPTSGAQEPDDSGPPPESHMTAAIRIPVNFVEVPFTVKDSKGQFVPGLTWRDVRVYENGLRQHMAVFSGTDPAPLSVALVVDQSVTFDTMTKVNNSLHALQDAFAPYDEVAVFTYNNGVKKEDGFTAAQSARLGVVLDRAKRPGREPNMSMGSALDQTNIKNNQIVDPNTTAVRNQQGLFVQPEKEFHTLLDAILAAAVETIHEDKSRRRIVYVISDGKEYGSTAKEKEVIRFCQRYNIEVYATLVGDSAVKGLGFLDRVHLPMTMNDDILPRVTTQTGGQIDREFRQGGIERSFSRITEQARTQYTLGFYSHEPIYDEKYRSLEVRIMKPGLTIYSKPGYYPTPRNSMPVQVTPSALP